MKYDQRVVAFIDILGFKELLNDTVDKNNQDVEKKINDLVEAYELIRKILQRDGENQSTSESKQVSIFSDCVVVSFPVTEKSEIFYTLLDFKYLIMELLMRGILCRGAISIGKFIHTDKYLFGPALVEAYLLESKAVMYPRVVLDREVIVAGAKNRNRDHSYLTERKGLRSLLEQDSDGMYYIDYFYKAQNELDDPELDFPYYIEELKEVIQKGLMASSHHSKVDLRVKYSWMRQRFNEMVKKVSNEKHIKNLKLAGMVDLADFYTALKPISPNKYKHMLISRE